MNRPRRLAILLVVVALACLSSLGVTFGSPATAATSNDSAVTLHGEGDFADLSVTVGQTKNLLSQVVPITWSGGKETLPGPYKFGINYLQIMQCWSDDASGPTREQCQYGGFDNDDRGGDQAALRQVNGDYTDPLETLKASPGKNAYVPFKSFDGDTSEGGTSDLFGRDTTNEVPFAATRADGSGQEFFNMQSVQDAPGLGCGEPVTAGGTVTGRSCWLVVVPRNNVEVDGSVHVGVSDPLKSSPLSATNWTHRLQTKLEFEPIGSTCPIGAAERRTIGQEVVSEAILRWQPSLCANGGAVYGYSQVPDDTSRRVLKSNKPGMVFLGRPLTAAENPDKLKVTYAPIGLSGLTVGFNVNSASVSKAPADVKRRDGQRLTEMKLTPRLVAKLITQTYSRAVNVDAPSVKDNPTDLTKDKEFQALNPQFDQLTLSLPELLIPGGRADTTEQLWNWLLGDADAKAFLAGTPDPWGTKVNPNFQGLTLPRPDYPKPDGYCKVYVQTSIPQPPLCTLDAHPYAPDMHAAARATSRGDSLARADWSPNSEPPAYKKSAPQYSGQRAMLALVDTASAARYGLETAAIRNAAGEFVKPTTATLLAGAAEMKKSAAPGVLTPAPLAKAKDAYPLATVGYAATVIPALDAAARKDYAALLTYAAGPGQVPGVLAGQLPEGYAPLTAAMRTQTRAAAAALNAYKDPVPKTEEEAAAVSPTTTTTTTPAATTAVPAGGTAVPVVDTAGAGVGTGTTAVPVALRTPNDAAGIARIVPFLALGLGLAAAICGPVMIVLGRRRDNPPAPA